MLAIINWSALSTTEQMNCLKRNRQKGSVTHLVQKTIHQVQQQGDQALYDLTRDLDKVQLSSLKVPDEHLQNARTNQKSLDAINKAIETISIYHQSMVPEPSSVCTYRGIHIRTEYRPIQKIGLYIPGGNNTPLVSSILMQAIPARIAGCPIKVLCTPPNSSGEIDPILLVTARLCGIETIYSIGGAQAIAAMAYGTDTVIKVDKIFGPGNAYVTEAKSIVSRDPEGAAIDMPAGPSELMIFADSEANPAFIAADLLAQAEHGPDSQVILLCETRLLAEQVNQQINEQLIPLHRSQFIKQSLRDSRILVCTDPQEQIKVINDYAPEHLIINRKDAEIWVNKITAVGTIFLGPWSAEAMGDYITGSNHVLPTNGFARNHNGLNTMDFMTRFTVQEVFREGVQQLGPYALTLAELEGLDAHANSISIRLTQ
ncbi:histidinol dehydrogenase [Legionella waltersii]|uniref:Histidinol dehydrogenase n=1 Tax=Legionella waltersii TaxID=66969 RepID=A0A0W1AN60_9GAMM|nr:histidinol dehydrogenase [Legionella waltersii]KTD82690.1 histidinol dehydrogenase [Legionella waltersii]SNV03324.1 histidinol dehydrogenase [Legionella waltersii]